ncbi:uncharacterized protein MONOS_967 [Monocercomonoides exilis]|uniref:uncharacterized protein n=1 Tax=Monocercomonoides exilis TaxID=2049356 RepID=UPI003559A4F0|nr:hypothetical protein MONOS_967 [Monocercomonoides exilis]|eukprot:MONOS_967.1-p1 / transcript=MONOS_967.1 / gene=MONOS_967 / organism=Monocercomonoides_exilis_PA203 / gene_product=unspecified product / transcript_product=unspecified product / location=Mono_scaffold00016:89250-94889(+) / protein_length=1879 / sequence_SO=supercontig / SO=protein_coding / is_pseudo=false
MEGKTFLLRNYTFDRCECHEGNGGGVNAKLTGNGEMIVNSTTIFEGCHANNLYHSQSRGGGIMIQIESDTCELSIESEVSFSVSNLNEANFGKDVFVCCNSGILLKSKVNESSFGFFEYTSIPSDVLKLCGSEDGKGEEVIPLFVYFHTIVSKLTADGNGEVALDHIYCGFEKFGCATVDYCLNNRANSTIHEIEVASETSIKCEMKVVSFNVSVSGKEERTRVPVRDEGSINQNWMIECTKSFEMCDLAFVLNEDMNGRRSAFIHSSSTVTITSCSFSFENSPLTEEKIGYNILNIEGGNLTVDGFVMEKTVTMNKVSPIIITNGVKLDIKNSRVSGVTVEGGSGEGGCIGAAIKEGGSAVVDNCSISTTCTGGGGMKGGGMMISVEDRGSLEINSVTFTGCQVPTEGNLQKGRGMGGGMFVSLADTMGSFVLEGVTFSECNAWKGKKVFISGNDLSEVMSNEKLKEELSTSDKKSLDELCGWERKTTGENGYVIPLVVYLWDNWSEKGFVSKEKGGDFSGCGFSEAPCSSIDHLISLRYEPLGKGESQISIGDSGLLSHPISFLSSLPTSPDSDDPAVVIKGTKKGTSVTITDEDGNAVSSGAMISSNVSLSFFNLSFIKPNITTQREIFIESSGTNTVLFVSNCSFGSLVGLAESFECYLIKVNGGSAAVQSCTLNKINELKGFIAFSPSTSQVTIQNVNISSATLKENSLISMTEEENQMNGNENTHLNGNKPVLKVVYCSFETIKNEGSSASVIELGSFDYAMECTIEDCTMSTCRSDLNTEGGGMKVVLKSEESVLKVNGSTFSTCRCSMESGRGGGLFIDGADTNVVYDNESQIPSLNFRFVNTLFWMNEAFAGKDIFIKCHSIEHQINETLFLLNYNQESLSSNNSICGKDVENERDVDLIPLITYYYGLHVFLNGTGADGRRCGAQSSPCSSINCAVDHIQEGVMNAILIDGEGVVSGECVIGDLNVNSYKKSQAIVRLNCKIEKSAEKDCVMEFVNECSVERCSFQFEDGFESTHNFLMKVKNGSMEIQKCEFFSFPTTTAEALKLNSSIVNVESGELKIFDSTFRDIHPTRSVLSFHEESDVTIVETRISNIKCEGDVVSVGGKAKVVMKIMAIENVSVASERCVVAMEDAEQEVSVLNCSFEKSANSVEKGSMMQIRRSKEVKVEICVFDGEKEEKEAEAVNGEQERVEKLCKWSGSLIDIENSNVEMKETTIRNSKVGGLWVSGGSVKIEKGEFVNNNPVIEGYPSLRRNIICSDSGTLNVMSLKGGDGLERNTSLWMLNDGCNFEGIVSERDSSFFIPVLESVETKEEADRMKLTFKGMLLVPCNLSFSVVKKKGDEKEIEKHDFDSNGFLSEREVEGSATKDLISTCGNETEVSVCIVFGNAESPSSTNSFILKNKSETEPKGDDRIVEGGKEGKSYWMLIVIIMAIILMIVLIVSVVLAVRWRKQKRRTEELEEIVNDNIRKDPKAFEMVTMEMSPEEQWRRAEREAEKKNEERIKKRVYEKSLGHSESSEHLLSESGSTEYILGRDSDKIPEWMLEKVDEKEEEEETRKRTPSPSISSTSTTDTSDTDTTFVRMEDACPTTSSMSNLVDAMACSSPHEKLIVDLRDSLFMLLHGQNKTKEMAIGTLQEREITAAQILFWVVNLALHSFDEMENPLQSLANLSPHIILFSEHMVICIATHSDCSSSDSDSSSISSSTIVTSSSDCSRRSKRFTNSPPPSSAFEDDDLRKECMRWKAPELLMNKKMGATKKSVVFSIGMMLWECLTLQIPFGEYEAEVAGQKIERGERPCSQVIIQSSFCGVIENCMNSISQMRPALFDLKKELFQHFPPGVMVVTASDAIDIANNLECSGRNNTSKIDPSQSW